MDWISFPINTDVQQNVETSPADIKYINITPPQPSGEIKVRFNSKNKPGVQNKTVTLTANTWPTTQRVRIKANVVKEGE